MMNVLIACEESQRVCIEFRKKGHNAYSCDIIDCSGGHPEWHIKQDVLPLLNGNCEFKTCDDKLHKINGKWDLIIAHPPCTHLTTAGTNSFKKKRENGSQKEAINFFMNFINADCERIVVENPIGIIQGEYIKKYFPDLCEKYNLPKKPTQIIQPWQFGDNIQKSTCLWIKGLQKLEPLTTKKPEIEYVEWINKKTGRKKRQTKWYFEAFKLPPEERSKVRSKTFPGIAKAMAEQWG